MVKKHLQSFTKMTKDITEGKVPNNTYFGARNIRFITDDSITTGGFSFEKGNDIILDTPTIEIDSLNSRIVYSNGIVSKTLEYSNNGTIQPRNEIEEAYYISDNNYRQSGRQGIIGHCVIKNDIILFSTDDNGFDCIWKLTDDTYDLTLLYLRNLGFNSNNPIQAINNYENEIIDKIYWVDGNNQLRFINIYHSEENLDLENLIDLSFSSINMVGTFDFNQPKITDITFGGIHTSGMIQYAYNLYKINGSQSKISPLTELIPLAKVQGEGGGDVNEIVGTVPVINIDTLDDNYTNLRLYAIKYTSFNQLPSVSLILDRDITTVDNVTYYDDGNIIESISLEEFLFLGSDVIIPKHINSKSNILFLSNYKEKNFDIDTYGNENSIDLRAFSFQEGTTTTEIYSSLKEDNIGQIVSDEPSYVIDSSSIDGSVPIPHKHPCMNINYDIYNRQYNNSIIGGEGPYLKYKIVRNNIGVDNFKDEDTKGKFIKDNEIYRLGIQFYNKYGQISLPKWIADFKNIVEANASNLVGFYASVEIELKPLFYVWLNDNNNFLDDNGNYDESLKPVGYRVLRAERTILDRSILCQGLINGMLSQVSGDTTSNNDPNSQVQIDRVHSGIKVPSLMRRFDEFLCPMWRNKSYDRLDRHFEFHPNFGNGPGDSRNEVYKNKLSSEWTQGTYQFTKLMQLFSPEIVFNNIQTLSGSTLKVVGGLVNDDNSAWGQNRDVETQVINDEGKSYTCIYPHDIKAQGANFNLIKGSKNSLQGHGFFGHTGGDSMNFVQIYRKYAGLFIQADVNESIYGNPEIAETGQGRTIYNDDADMFYSNSIEPISADSILRFVNSWGIRCAMFALGGNDAPTQNRKGIEDLHISSGIVDTGVGLIGEFRINRNLIYIGNLYGGNSYESKKRSNYLEVGEYQEINNNIYNCINFGDTFVDNFKFTKLVKTETEVYNRNSEQVTEIVEFRVETTVDIKNRHDQSLKEWDNRFQPREDEYQQYNTVYSQDSNLIVRRDTDYRFKKVDGFNTNVISTKTKVAGEIIDSWSDLQPNNVITLDGKFGDINGLISYKDELYTFQDRGIAALSILPRIQVTGDDGISIELGSGKVLQEYKYLTINSGSINKWGILPTEVGIFYIDVLNKSFNMIGSSFKGISDEEELHKFFRDSLEDETTLKVDNPFLNKGVSLGWDKVTNDIYITIRNNDKDITITYNFKQGFSSEYDYHSPMYIHTKGKTLTLNPNTNTQIYENFIGDYNIFYDENKPSSITFICNPEPLTECTFNNLEYKSEAFDENGNEISYTWEKIRASNEFQNSELRALQNRINLRRTNRKWRLNIPRHRSKKHRMRNNWVKIHLESDNLNKYKYRNQDIILYYNPNNKFIQ